MITGYKRFRETYFGGETELFRRLKGGQTPKTLVIACSDSRGRSGVADVGARRGTRDLADRLDEDEAYRIEREAIAAFDKNSPLLEKNVLPGQIPPT